MVKNRREGKNIYYKLNNYKVLRLLEESNAVLSEIVSGLYLCVNYMTKQLRKKTKVKRFNLSETTLANMAKTRTRMSA